MVKNPEQHRQDPDRANAQESARKKVRQNVDTIVQALDLSDKEMPEWQELTSSVFADIPEISTVKGGMPSIDDDPHTQKFLHLHTLRTDLTNKQGVAVQALSKCLDDSVNLGKRHRYSLEQREVVLEEMRQVQTAQQLYLVALIKEDEPKTAPAHVEKTLHQKLQPLPLDVAKEDTEKAVENSATLHRALDMPSDVTKQWTQFIEDIGKPLPLPGKAIDVPSGNDPKHKHFGRLQFLRSSYQDLVQKKRACFEALGFMSELLDGDKEQKFDELERAILLEVLTEYWQGKREYERIWNREEKPAPMLPYVSLIVEEFAEEGLEVFMPLKKQWTSKHMRAIDIQARRKIFHSSLVVRKRLMQQGAKRFPGLMKLMMRNEKAAGIFGKIFKEVGKGMRPDSYFTVVLFAYYVHSAKDKTAAAMQFASFLALSGISNAGLASIEMAATRALVGTRFALLAKIPGHPGIKIGAAIALAVGVDKLIGFENITNKIKRNTDPNTWDGIGMTAELFSGGIVYDQVGEIGYQTGLKTVDPEADQIKYLGGKVYTMDYSKGEMDMNYFHSIRDWDDNVEWKMGLTTNPIKQKLWKVQMIDRGPGGRQGWTSRQALSFYQGVSRLRATQEHLHALIIDQGILSSEEAESIIFDDIVTKPGVETGDLQMRYAMQKGLLRKADNAILALKKKNGKDADVNTLHTLWLRCQQMASSLAKMRSTYEHLGVYHSSWLKEREVKNSETGEIETTIPKIVEDGMISSLVLHSWRAEALGIDAHEDLSPRQYGEKLANVLQLEKKDNGIPVILDDPIEWFKKTREYNSGYNRRRMKEHSKDLLEMFSGELSRSASPELRKKVFEPLQKMLVEQSDQLLHSPHEATVALTQAYVRLNQDGGLRKSPATSQKFTDWSEDGGPKNVRKIENFYTYGGVIPRGFELTMPIIRPPNPMQVDEKYAKQFPNIKVPNATPPVIASTTLLEKSRIDTLTLFDYNANTKEWTVSIRTATRVDDSSYYTTGWRKGLNPEGTRHTISRSTIKQGMEEWMEEHPQFASQLTTDLRKYEEAKMLEKKQWDNYRLSYKQEMKYKQVEEISDQEKARERALKNPNVWIPYSTQITQLDKDDTKPSYEFVAHLEGEEGFIYLQIPLLYRGRKYWMNNSRHVVAKKGNHQMTRITHEYEKNKSGITWDRYPYKTDLSMPDKEELADNKQLNAVALDLGLFFGPTRIYRAGTDVLMYENDATRSNHDGELIITIPGKNQTTTAEFTFKDDQWMWRTKGSTRWENNHYIVDPKKTTDVKIREDREYLNSIASRAGIFGEAEYSILSKSTVKEAQYLKAKNAIGEKILSNQSTVKKITDNGRVAYVLSAKNGTTTVECAFIGGRWNWRTKGETQWDNRSYVVDPKKLKNAKMREDREYLNAIARRVGIWGEGEIPNSLPPLTDKQIGETLLLHKFGAKRIEQDGETLYRLQGKNGKETAYFAFKNGRWLWRSENMHWSRLTLDGGYLQYIDKHLDSYPKGSNLYQQGLALPIEGRDQESIQKVLAVYVQSMESSDTIKIEDHIYSAFYKHLNKSDRYGFLRVLERETYHATRGTKTDAKGFLWLDRVTYKTSEFKYKLNSRMYYDKVFPALKKYVLRQGYTFD